MEQNLKQNFFQNELQIFKKTYKTTIFFISHHIYQKTCRFESIIKNLVLKITNHSKLKKINCFPRSPTLFKIA